MMGLRLPPVIGGSRNFYGNWLSVCRMSRFRDENYFRYNRVCFPKEITGWLFR